MTGQLRIFAGVLFACSAFTQLIPSGTAVPRASKPPVLFINGFQTLCTGGSFSGTFGTADQVLQANGEVSLFFDTCSVPGTPTIEDLGTSLGSLLASLRYVDGTPVDQVDVVAHSMGGLVLRSYLSGKQNIVGAFAPPLQIRVRKAVFLATPHFGTGIAATFGVTPQLRELASGSRFLFDLGTWNQGSDDLRGVDAVGAAGNGGTGVATMKGFDDGVVALTSASLRFYQPGRTRVLPFCHVNGGGLVSLAGLCSSGAQGIANISSVMHNSARIIVSFLNGTDDWKNVGVAAEDDPFLSVDGGLIMIARTADDSSVPLTSATAGRLGMEKQLNIPSGDVAYTDLFPAGPLTLTAGSISNSITLPAGGVEPYIVKAGPHIARVLPSAANVFPLSVAPGTIVAIYGTSLAAQVEQASGLPLPLQLSDSQVTVTERSFNTTQLPLFYASPSQINAVIPTDASGLAKLTVTNGSGSHTVNVLIEAAVPAIFTLDGSGTGRAAALNASNNQVVESGHPLHAGDYVELYATGLGATTNRNGLDYAILQPTVAVGGQDCPVTYAGRAPGYVGLDQINCIVPAGLAANADTPVIVTSGNRSSNVATLAVE